LAIVTGCGAAFVDAGVADDAFYKGKTVTILVGFGVGGGNDLYARLLARYLGKYIPGNPTVIVENLPGEGSLAAVRQLDLSGARDGSMITTFQSGTITQSVATPDKMKIDFRNYAWVGVASGEVRVCYGYGPNGVKSWDDLMSRKQFVLGTTSKGSASYINGAMLRMFGAPVKLVLGYTGAHEQRLAVQRGELDGDCGGISSIPSDWLRDGLAHIFVRFSDKHPPEIPDSSLYLRARAKTDEQRQLFDMLTATDQLGRVFVMSSLAPPERVNIMRQAFDAAMKDKDFLAEAAKEQLPIDPMTGFQADRLAEKILSASPEVVALAKDIYN
jgi:tripartite-type tricarboxylate transporter receptor subunit TctC